MWKLITPPQNPLIRSTPSDEVKGTIKKIAVINSPSPRRVRFPRIPAGICLRASGRGILALRSFITPAMPTNPPSSTCKYEAGDPAVFPWRRHRPVPPWIGLRVEIPTPATILIHDVAEGNTKASGEAVGDRPGGRRGVRVRVAIGPWVEVDDPCLGLGRDLGAEVGLVRALWQE